MIKRLGSVFDTRAKCIGHGVNCKGVMGAGVAKIFKDKFPENYDEYANLCRRQGLLPGDFLMHEENGFLIFNIASQRNPGAAASYAWLFKACWTAARTAVGHGHNMIAIPQIGCGIGGLEWDKVETLLAGIEILVPGFEWEVWKLDE